MYSGIFAVLSLLAIYEVTKARRDKSLEKRSKFLKVIFFLCVLLLICFSGFRGELGTDYKTYERYYSALKSGNAVLSSIEPAYFVLARFSKSFQTFLFLIAVISVGIKSKLIYEKSDYVFVSMLLYFSYMYLQFDMGIVRQGLALAFTLWAVDYIEEQKLWKFILIECVAMVFHYSSMVFLAAYFIASRKISRKVIYGGAGVALVLSFTNFWIGISYVLNFLSTIGFSKYSWYMTNESYRAGSFGFLDLQRILMLIFFTELIKRSEDNSNRNNVYLNLYFISTVMYYLFRTFSAISSRGSYYYTAMEILLFPSILKEVKSPYRRVIFVFLIILYCLIYVYNTINQYTVGDYYNLPYLPYTTWLFK